MYYCICPQEHRNMTAIPALKPVFPHKYLNHRNQGTVEVQGTDKHTYDTSKSNNTKQIVIYNE